MQLGQKSASKSKKQSNQKLSRKRIHVLKRFLISEKRQKKGAKSTKITERKKGLIRTKNRTEKDTNWLKRTGKTGMKKTEKVEEEDQAITISARSSIL